VDVRGGKHEARTLIAVGVPASIALAGGGVALWRSTATYPCPAGGVCLGHTTYHSHVLLSILLWAAAAVLTAALVAANRVGHGRLALRGGWRHPIDAGGIRFSQLPHWRRVALVILAFPIVVWWWVIYQVRRLLFGPVD
jgi:hypothetical protein